MVVPLHFRQDLTHQSGFMEHSAPSWGLALGKDSNQFLPNAFAAYLPDVGSHAAHRFPGVWFDGVTEARAKTDGAQDPEFVLFEALVRIADRADDFRLDVIT